MIKRKVHYESAEIEVIKICINDVIATSGPGGVKTEPDDGWGNHTNSGWT